MGKKKTNGGGDGAALPLLQNTIVAPSLSPPPVKATIKSTYGATTDSPTAATSSPSSPASTASSSSSSRPRVASAELIVPAVENVSSVYYGVDAFSPTLVDFYTVDQKRIVWSSRAHRKMMMTLYAAWHGKPWKRASLSFWAGSLAIVGYGALLVGGTAEIVNRKSPPTHVHALVDIPLLIGALCLVTAHTLTYFEVINSCHNLEIWLDEYFHGYEPVLERRFVGVFPSRIDFWTELLGIVGSLLYVAARVFILVRSDPASNFGAISISRAEGALIIGYWVPFFLGSFALLLSAYLAHVEVVHRWFSWRLDRLETWVTGLGMISAMGVFVSSTLQFMDPMDVIFTFETCITPFGVGCVVGIASGILSLVELETIHKRHKHPEYGLLKNPSGYGTAWN